MKYHGKVGKTNNKAEDFKENGKIWKKHVKGIARPKTTNIFCTQALLWICGACHVHVLAERQSRGIVGVLNTDEEAGQLKLRHVDSAMC